MPNPEFVLNPNKTATLYVEDGERTRPLTFYEEDIPTLFAILVHLLKDYLNQGVSK